MRGIVTSTGLALHHAGQTVPLAPTLTPLGEAVAALIAQIDAGEVKPCGNCGEYTCDCDEWLHYMMLDPDPHGDLSGFDGMEIPF